MQSTRCSHFSLVSTVPMLAPELMAPHERRSALEKALAFSALYLRLQACWTLVHGVLNLLDSESLDLTFQCLFLGTGEGNRP